MSATKQKPKPNETGGRKWKEPRSIIYCRRETYDDYAEGEETLQDKMNKIYGGLDVVFIDVAVPTEEAPLKDIGQHLTRFVLAGSFGTVRYVMQETEIFIGDLVKRLGGEV